MGLKTFKNRAERFILQTPRANFKMQLSLMKYFFEKIKHA
jgi:hypothetical protein